MWHPNQRDFDTSSISAEELKRRGTDLQVKGLEELGTHEVTVYRLQDLKREAATQQGARPCYVYTYTVLGRKTEAVEAYNHIEERLGGQARKPGADHATLLMQWNRIVEKLGPYAEARDVLQGMKDAGLVPEEATYNTLIKLARDHQQVKDLLAQMAQADMELPPDPFERQQLLADLRSDDFQRRTAAASRLCAAGEPAAHDTVLALIKSLSHEASDVRVRAARALAAIGKDAKGAVPALKDRLEVTDEEYIMLVAALEALMVMGEEAKEAVPAAMKLLKHNRWEVRAHAAGVLGAIGSEAAVEPLTEVLRDEGAHVRAPAARALGRIGEGTPEVMSGLRELLDDDELYVRIEAAHALFKLGDASGIKRILEPLKSESAEMRSWAIKRLIGIADARILPELIKLLDSEYEDVRRPAAWALGNIGEEARDAVPLLIQMLEDWARSMGERIDAAYALGRIGSAEAVKALRARAEDTQENDGLRAAAHDAGRKIQERADKEKREEEAE